MLSYYNIHNIDNEDARDIISNMVKTRGCTGINSQINNEKMH